MKPESLNEEHLQFLNGLESWGATNLSAEVVFPYFKRQFPELSVNECVEIINYWAKTRNQLLNENAN